MKNISTKMLNYFPICLVLFELACYSSNDMYLPGVVRVMQDLHTTQELTQWSLTAWFAGIVIIQPLSGPLSDRYGRRPLLLGGACLFIASSVLCAISPNITWLIIGRALEGCSVASIYAAGYACLHEAFDRTRVIKITSWMMAITLLAPGLGPLIGAVLLKFTTWRYLFVLLVVVAITALIGLNMTMPETLTKEKRQPIDIKVNAATYWRLLTDKIYMLYTATPLMFGAIFLSWIVIGPFLTTTTYHYPPMAFAWIQFFVSGGFIVGTLTSNRTIERFGPQCFINWSIYITLAACAIFVPWMLVNHQAMIAMVALLVSVSLGMGLSIASYSRLGLESNHEPAGSKMVISTIFYQIFAVIGSTMASLFQHKDLRLYAVTIGALILIATLMKRALPRVARPEQSV